MGIPALGGLDPDMHFALYPLEYCMMKSIVLTILLCKFVMFHSIELDPS